MADYTCIEVTKVEAVMLIRLNRPKALNALNAQTMRELGEALAVAQADDEVGAIVLTGSERAFAAGADIKEMADYNYMDVYLKDFITTDWEHASRCRKPLIAAVSGFALGGGCELAMACDFILAADNAKFGQPEITIGTIPGAGGTQRLTRLIGKSKAMELCLTGRLMDAQEAERAGLVARIVPADTLVEEALSVANKIAAMSRPVTMMVKDAVNAAYETSLNEGMRVERRIFHATFALSDQTEGMQAFVEKRPPTWRNG